MHGNPPFPTAATRQPSDHSSPLASSKTTGALVDEYQMSPTATQTRPAFIPAPVHSRTRRKSRAERFLSQHFRSSSLSSLSLPSLSGAQTSGRDALERVREFGRNNAGLLLIALSQLFFALMNMSVKQLNKIDPPIPPLELVWVRMIITYVCCMTYMLSTGVPDPFLGPKGVRLLLVFRGFIGFFGLFGLYFSLQYLSLSDAIVITFLAPFCTAIAGWMLLGERLRRGEIGAGLVSLFGVVLIARPAFLFGAAAKMEDGVTPAQRVAAVAVALMGVVGATGAFISIRAIGKRAHALHTLTSFSSQCVIAATIFMVVLHIPVVFPTKPLWLLLLLLIGIFGFIAQTLLTLGLQRETAGRGSIGMYAQLVFATLLDRIVFHATPQLLSVCGTAVIMGAAVYVALTKTSDNPPRPTSTLGAAAAATAASEAARRKEEADAELEEGLLLHHRSSSAADLADESDGELDLDALEAELKGEVSVREGKVAWAENENESGALHGRT